jgi:hypothetical protein
MQRTHVAALSAPQVAFIGFATQALVTRTQPIEGLTKHLADPFGKNISESAPCADAACATMRSCVEARGLMTIPALPPQPTT